MTNTCASDQKLRLAPGGHLKAMTEAPKSASKERLNNNLGVPFLRELLSGFPFDFMNQPPKGGPTKGCAQLAVWVLEPHFTFHIFPRLGQVEFVPRTRPRFWLAKSLRSRHRWPWHVFAVPVVRADAGPRLTRLAGRPDLRQALRQLPPEDARGPRAQDESNGRVGQRMGSHVGVGAPPIEVYFRRDWDVHWGYKILTRGHMDPKTHPAIREQLKS